MYQMLPIIVQSGEQVELLGTMVNSFRLPLITLVIHEVLLVQVLFVELHEGQ